MRSELRLRPLALEDEAEFVAAHGQRARDTGVALLTAPMNIGWGRKDDVR